MDDLSTYPTNYLKSALRSWRHVKDAAEIVAMLKDELRERGVVLA